VEGMRLFIMRGFVRKVLFGSMFTDVEIAAKEVDIRYIRDLIILLEAVFCLGRDQSMTERCIYCSVIC